MRRLLLLALLTLAACKNPPQPAGPAPDVPATVVPAGPDPTEVPAVTPVTPVTPVQDSKPPISGPGACRSDGDCRLFSDYCKGCDCRALARDEAEPKCDGPGVRCVMDPCKLHRAACVAGKCVTAPKGAAPTE